jgi:hypothetical protein
MAGKEATVYILDLGESMGEKRHGRDKTDLEWALEYIWDKITTTVSQRIYAIAIKKLFAGVGGSIWLRRCVRSRREGKRRL